LSQLSLACLFASLLAINANAVQGEDDLVEFITGRKLQGKVVSIRKAEKEFDFQYKIGGRDFVRTYKFGAVRAVTMGGKRHLLTKPGTEAEGSSPSRRSTTRGKSKAQIERLIADVGPTKPDWFDSSETNFPRSLDMAWPLKPPKGWNNQKNVGQYIWDIVNPNPNRWRSGVKLVHQCMALHKGDRRLLERDMNTLGKMYFSLFQDYPRAAYWWRKSGTHIAGPNGILLAEAYWRMGSRSMAEEMLRSRTLPISSIKLLGDMGQVDRAVQLAKAVRMPRQKTNAFLLAADALRSAGRMREAISYYQKVLEGTANSQKNHEKASRARAKDSIDAIQLADRADVRRVASGVYRGSAVGFVGNIDVEVQVADGKITSVRVIKHREKQFYSAIRDTTKSIQDSQGVRGIDATSGATITSQAIVNATARVLASGAK
jgi:uncharacterized protein with FMN-binding domain